MCGCDNKKYPPLEIVAGDDYTFKVRFKNREELDSVVLTPEDRIEMTFGVEEPQLTIEGTIVDGNCGTFYLSTEDTIALEEISNPKLVYNVHIYWANGGRNTPICNGRVRIKECYNEQREDD